MFEALVKNDTDAIGLIAYALYKHKKHSLAQSLRDQGFSEQHIQDQVKIFHDQTLHNSLSDYRVRAENYMNAICVQLEKDITTKFDEREKQFKQSLDAREAQTKKDCDARIKKERRQFIKSVQEYEKTNKSMLSIFGAWLISGIPGILASFLITALVIGASVLLVSEEKRKEVFASLVAEYVGIAKDKPKSP